MTTKSIQKKLSSSHSTGVYNQFVNLCPHNFDLYCKQTDKLVVSIPPSGTICNVVYQHVPVTDDKKNPLADYGIEAFYIPKECVEITGLPDFDFVKQNKLLLFVSCVVQQAISTSTREEYKRYEPYLVVATMDRNSTKRNEKGTIIGNYSISIAE
jgi:hypothetical protein